MKQRCHRPILRLYGLSLAGYIRLSELRTHTGIGKKSVRRISWRYYCPYLAARRTFFLIVPAVGYSSVVGHRSVTSLDLDNPRYLFYCLDRDDLNMGFEPGRFNVGSGGGSLVQLPEPVSRWIAANCELYILLKSSIRHIADPDRRSRSVVNSVPFPVYTLLQSDL